MKMIKKILAWLIVLNFIPLIVVLVANLSDKVPPHPTKVDLFADANPYLMGWIINVGLAITVSILMWAADKIID